LFRETGDDQAYPRRATSDAQGSTIDRRPIRRRLLRYAAHAAANDLQLNHRSRKK
jgi:hypothetical protein